MSEIKVEIVEDSGKMNKTVETNIEIEESSRDSKPPLKDDIEDLNSNKSKDKKEKVIETVETKRKSILNEFQKAKEVPIKNVQPSNQRSRSLKTSPEKVKKSENLVKINNVVIKEKNSEKKLRPSSPLLQRFMKPAPKIYKKKQIGKKKYVIHAEKRAGIDSESFYAKTKKQKSKKRNFHAYDLVDFEEDSEEDEEMSVKFWSKKNLIRSISTNPRGFARLMGNKINMIDQIQRLVQLENRQKKKQKNMFRSVDISLKEKKHQSMDNRKRDNSKDSTWDPSREKLIQVGTSSSLWEKTNLKKKMHQDKQKKKKRFKHLIYSSVQVEKSEAKNKITTFSKQQNEFGNNSMPVNVNQEEEIKKSIYKSPKAAEGLKNFMRFPEQNEVMLLKKQMNLKNIRKESNMKNKRENEENKGNFQLYKSNSRLDNADGITVELEEDRTVCLDDMETKLCLFFKKTLVYTSKIELLKLKAQKENGEHNIYSLFRQFCDPDTGKLTITSMQFLVEVLQYPLEEYDISSVLLFLEKFKEVDADAPLELEYGEFRELFISHKVSTPEIYLFSNWVPYINKEFNLPDSEFYLLRQILMLTTRQIRDVTRIIRALRAYTADSLFNYISLFNEENDKIEGNLNNFFYTDDLQEMKESFQVQIDFTSKRVQNQQIKRPKSANVQADVPSFSNNFPTRSFRNPSFSGSPPDAKKEVEVTVEAEVKENVVMKKFETEFNEKEEKSLLDQDELEEINERDIETRSNYSSLVKPQSILNQHIRYKKVKRIKQMSEFKNAKQKPIVKNYEEEEVKITPLLKKGNEEELEMMTGNANKENEVEMMNNMIKREEEKQYQVNISTHKSLESQANLIDVSTIRNFLNFHGVMFLEEDLELVMHCLGSAHGIVDREAFKRFFYSPLWD
jgi:hypothetical protein